MIFASVEIKTECQKCGNPVMINGPVLKLLCNSCQNETEITAMTWKSILGDLVNEIRELKPGEGIESQTLAGSLNRNMTVMREKPACHSCGTLLQGIPDSIKEEATLYCPKCGSKNRLIPAPSWLTLLVPEAVLLVNALSDAPDGDKEIPAGKPVFFTCPGCAGNLKVDGTSRLVTCRYCSADIYLPDDLWLRMHPVETVKKWYIGFTTNSDSLKNEKLNAGLLEAAYDTDDDTGEELLNEGADPDITDHNGRSALFLAAATGARKLVRLLVEKGADIDRADSYGTTPLNIAAYNGNTNIVKTLLAENADVNIPNRLGVTALNAAAKTGQIEIVKLLLKKGADPLIPNEDGKRPLERAKEEGHKKIVALLKKYEKG